MMAHGTAGKWARRLTLALLGLLAAYFFAPLLMVQLIWQPVEVGTRLDVERARRIVLEQPALLSEIQALGPLTDGEPKRRRAEALAQRIGAQSIRTDAVDGGHLVKVCFRYWGGAGETYFEGLQWLPPPLVEEVRGGRYRPGEYREELSGGWFWVVW